MKTIREEPWFANWKEFLLSEAQPDKSEERQKLQALKAQLNPLGVMSRDIARKYTSADLENLLAAVEASSSLHVPWLRNMVDGYLGFVNRSGLTTDDPVTLRVVVNNLYYLLNVAQIQEDQLAGVSSVQDLVMKARTTPDKNMQQLWGLDPRSKNYYRDLDDSMALVYSGGNKPFSVVDIEDPNEVLFVLSRGSDGWLADDRVNLMNMNQFLELVPDGIEDGLRYFGLI